jgi:16S rRNA G966 N2-methylase RsmD
MRIIAGIHRTRQIDAPGGLTTRPMTDRVRENLFNLLGDTVVDATVLDLFCGSGRPSAAGRPASRSSTPTARPSMWSKPTASGWV